MSIFSKKIKNVFAKKSFLPFLFVAIFMFSFAFCLFPFQKSYANTIYQNENDNNQVTLKNNTNLDSKNDITKENNVNSKNANISLEDNRNKNVKNANYLQGNNKSVLNEYNLPKEFSLFYIDRVITNFSTENKGNTNNLPKNVGAQGGTSICWAFAVNTALETTLYKSGVVENDEILNFSELNIAYVSQVINRDRTVVTGGNFDLAYEYLSSEYGPVYEQTGEGCPSTNTSSRWASDSSVTSFYKNNYYNSAITSHYRVLEAVSFPDKKTLNTQNEKDELRKQIKNHILNYGGVTASIYMDSGNLINNQTYVCTNSTLKQNHMVTLVGWDDDFSTTTGGKTYTGAYIVQNSSGTNWGMNGYFYIMYDDAFVENDVNGFLRVGKELDNSINYNNLKDTKYNNQFLTFSSNSSGSGETSYNIKNITEDFYITNIYKKEDISNQFISRLKIPTSYNNSSSNFYVYVLNGLSSQNVQSQNAINSYLQTNFSNATRVRNKYADSSNQYLFTANQATYYTIEMVDDIYITSEYFAIIIQYTSGSVIRLANDDSSLSQLYQFTYVSNNATDWSSYYSNDTENKVPSIMPMIVQMKYDLGALEYTYSNIQKTYDGNNIVTDVIVSTECEYQIFYSLTGNNNDWTTSQPFIVNCGSYEIYFKIEADFYQTVQDSIEVEISKKDIIITPISDQKTYGDGDPPTIGFNYSGNIETPSFVGRLSRETGENVGSYKILQGTLELNSSQNFNKNNYNLMFSSGSVYFNITPRNLYVVPNLTSKIYGNADPIEITYSYSNVVTGEIAGFNGSLSRENGESAGLYGVVLNTLTLKNNPAQNRNQKDFLTANYNLVLKDNQEKFTIEKRSLIITPDAHQSKIYGKADPTFSYTYTNNVNNEIPIFTGRLSRETGEDANRYNYLLGTLELMNNGNFLVQNYKLVLEAGDRYFTITYGDLDGCKVEDINKTYDGSYYYLKPTNTIYNDVSYAFSLDRENWSNQTIKIKNAGTHIIFVKFTKQNYNDNVIQATIKIDPLTLIITPNQNQSKVYGEQDDVLNFTYSGNIENEIPAFSGELSREFDRNSPINERVGKYLINKGNLSLKDNENFLASNYEILFSLNGEMYEITPRELTIIPNANQYKYYNTADKMLKYSFSGLVQGETPIFSGNLDRENGEEVGSYKIIFGDLTMEDNENFLSSNYTLKILDEYFEICPAKITIKIDNVQSYYTQEVITNFTYTILQNAEDTGSFKEGDDLNISFICSVNNSTLKGIYNISCSTNNNNYEVTIINGKYEILYYSYLVQFSLYNQIIHSFTAEHFYTLKTTDFPQVEINTGYSFDNWLVWTDNGTFSIVNENYTITNNVTIVAFVKTNEYKISYNTNGGTFVPVITSYTIETPTFIINHPVKQGYTFEGWYNNPNFMGEKITKIENGSIGEINLYAKYSINTYQISFKNETSSNLPYTLFYNGSTDIKFNNSFKFMVLLKEEYNQSYGKMKVYARLTTDNDLTARTNGQIVYGIDTLETSQEQETSKGDEGQIIELTTDVNGYYVIDKVLGNYEIYCENITLNTYSVFFLVDNKIVGKPLKKTHGESLNSYEFPVIPTKEHYNQFAPYWSVNQIEEVTKDEVIIATYVPNVHIITFVMPDGKEYKVNANYGESIDTSILKENYHLGVFKYFLFSSSIDNVTGDKTIKVKIASNVFILYIVLAVVATIIVVIVSVTLIKKRKRDTFNWWVYTKRK